MLQAMGPSKGDRKIKKEKGKHYNSVDDPESVEFREFCWMVKDSRIECDPICQNFESKNPVPPGGY